MLGAMVFWDRYRTIGRVILVLLLLFFVFQTDLIAAPIEITTVDSEMDSHPSIALMEKRASAEADHIRIRDRVEDSVSVQALRTVFHTIQDQPNGDQTIVSTYQKEECFQFLAVAFGRADLNLQTVLFESTEVSFFRNGDLVKLDNSIYRGLAHWGIYWDGYILHNWEGFHREPSGVFLVEYAQPGSTFHIYHPSFPHSPGSRLVIFQ
jgi:hypothetical protein